MMTSIGVTNREGDYNRRTEAHDWKRRGERLVRASGLSYRCKSFELVATQGPAQHDLDAEFARLDADPPGALDAVHDLPNMPLQEEPQRVRRDVEAVGRQS